MTKQTTIVVIGSLRVNVIKMIQYCLSSCFMDVDDDDDLVFYIPFKII